MEYTLLLDTSENIQAVIAEEQTRFIKSILEALEVPFTLNEKELTPLEKEKFRNNLKQYNISIISQTDGNVKIFVEKDFIAEWNKPKYKLKKDHNQIDPKKRLYYEMKISFASIFDNEKQEMNET